MAKESKSREVTMTERAAITKYSMVPLGAMISGMIFTAGVMQWHGAERERILVLETKVEAIEKSEYAHTRMLDTIHDDLIRIKIKLGITDGRDPGAKLNERIRQDGHKTSMAFKDNVGRRTSDLGDRFGMEGN